ncbi:MAG: aminoglycoside phosphotransferase family protein [Verrucomicrobiaceae bacterium]|nr:MAG: aminoglycoside phosphotransferase family protein [Verrucomicrobiaceae bacterium]
MTTPTELELPIRAAVEVAAAHKVMADRCGILQNGNTLVLRLTESLVARVVTDLEGPRQGDGWFQREIAVARHLAERGAPVIPVHPLMPPGPYEHLGYTLNFWQYVTPIEAEAGPAETGRTLFQCHELLRSYDGPLPELAIPVESLALLETLERRGLFAPATIRLLRGRLETSLEALRGFPRQPLHGDAHPGNLMNTTLGPLWTDWEDTFLGPVEWDLASVIWNARILDNDHRTADAALDAYREAGGRADSDALHQSMIARAAVMIAWYPILYPAPSPERRVKLQQRLDWLRGVQL